MSENSDWTDIEEEPGSDSDSAASADLASASVSKDSPLDLSMEEWRSLIVGLHCEVEPLHIDLIKQLGSFGPFLVDGSSLFRQVASNPYLDWKHGGQFLHAAYVAERFLAHLLEKGQNITMFCFEDENQLQPELLQMLLCEQLQEHFRRLGNSARGFQLHILPGNWLTPDGSCAFQELVRAVGPSCVLVDFGRPMPLLQQAPKTDSVDSTGDFAGARSCGFVHWLHTHGLLTASLENLQASGPKVAVELLTPTKSSSRHRAAFLSWLSHKIQDEPRQAIPVIGPDLKELCAGLLHELHLFKSTRLIIGVLAMRQLVQQFGPHAELTTDTSLYFSLTAAFCMSLSLQQTLPLRQRCVANGQLEHVPKQAQAQVSDFLTHLYESVIHALVCYKQVQPLGSDGTLPDVIDGRMFHFVVGHVSNALPNATCFQFLPCSAATLAERLWGKCADQPLYASCKYLIGGATATKKVNTSETTVQSASAYRKLFDPPPRVPHADQPLSTANVAAIRTALSKSHEASELLSYLDEREEQQPMSASELQLSPFQPHHFHSCRPLDDTFPHAFHVDVSSSQTKTVRIDTHGQAQQILSVLADDGLVCIGREQKVPTWMRAIKLRGVTFRLAAFTDKVTAAMALSDRPTLRERLVGEPAFPIIIQFSMMVSQSAHEMRAQKKSRAQTKFIKSLLQGAPVKPQTISERHSPAVLEQLRQQAALRLTSPHALPACPPTTNAASNSRHGHKAPKTQKLKEGGSGSCNGTRSVDRVRQQLGVKQQKELMKQAIEQIADSKQTLKKLSGKELTDALESLQAKAKNWWDGGAKPAAAQAHQVCLKMAIKLDEECTRDKSCPRWTFLAFQAALRLAGGPSGLIAHCEDEGAELLRRMECHAINDLKMPAMAAALKSEASEEQASGKKKKSKEKQVTMPTEETCPFRFQLEILPEHLSRPVGIEDPRVQGFQPDDWQSSLLDVVDAGQSALVLAPTASGKTFISFYVMEKVLRTDDDGVVVYVCPTKALANQIYAEIQARYSKVFKTTHNRAVAGIFTRDFRENALECQVLVTVPQCALIFLLSPTEETRQWTARLRHAIVDEVHCIGHSDGSEWEQLLLLLDCPIIALSATLGKAAVFTEWLQSVEKMRGRTMHVVRHTGRFNDLQPWVFGCRSLHGLHPYLAATSHRPQRGGTQHIHMIPEDCLKLYDALSSSSEAVGARDLQGWADKLAALSPERFFAKVNSNCWSLSMQDVKAWQLEISQLFDDAPQTLQVSALNSVVGSLQDVFDRVERDVQHKGELHYLQREIPSLAKALLEHDMLPAICFHNSRDGCLSLAIALFRQLEREEAQKRTESGEDKRVRDMEHRLEELEQWLSRSRLAKNIDRGEGASGNPLKVTSAEGSNLEEMERLNNQIRHLRACKREFSMCIKGVASITRQELEEEFAEFDPGANWHHRILLRGIGVHHAGLPKQYRQTVERLFRMRKLGLVVSTSTLALGINMPSKTSVFAGDSVYLDVMQYQQEAGRAGRRGFDLRGHTVFFGLPMQKVQFLIGAELPVIRGNRALTPSLVLRIMMKLRLSPSQTGASAFAGAAIARVLDRPLFCPNPSIPLVNSNLAIFYICDMLRSQLLDESLGATDLAGFVAHIFWETPGNFALVELLRDPEVLEEMCINREQLVLLLCHLFCRRSLSPWMRRQLDVPPHSSGSRGECWLLRGPSLVALPAIQGRAHQVIAAHTSTLLQTAVRNLTRFAEACRVRLGDERELPLTKVSPCVSLYDEARDGAMSPVSDLSATPGENHPSLRSPFVALSGHGDEFSSLEELCETSLECLRLEPDMFPALDIQEDDQSTLNGYIFDFYKHGQVSALIEYNRISGSELWTLLDNFRMILKALSAAAQHRSFGSAFSNSQVVSALVAISDEFDANMKHNDYSRIPL